MSRAIVGTWAEPQRQTWTLVLEVLDIPFIFPEERCRSGVPRNFLSERKSCMIGWVEKHISDWRLRLLRTYTHNGFLVRV